MPKQAASSMAINKAGANSLKSKDAKIFLIKRIEITMGILSLQFLVGMAINIIGEPNSSTSHNISNLWHGLLVLHILLGVALLAIALFIVWYSAKNYSQLKKPTTLSLIGIVLAIVFGALTLSHFHEGLMSFLMALSFLIAIANYGRTLTKVGPIH